MARSLKSGGGPAFRVGDAAGLDEAGFRDRRPRLPGDPGHNRIPGKPDSRPGGTSR